MVAEPEMSAARGAVPPRTVIASILGVWLCYFVLVTLRSVLTDPQSIGSFLGLRAIVTLSGIAITIVMWLILRRIDHRSVAVRIAATLALAAPAAIAVAAINTIVFKSVDDAHYILDDGRTRIEMDAQGNIVIDMPGEPRRILKAPSFVTEPGAPRRPIDPPGMSAKSIWKELSEIAIGRYFLLIGWGALFLALGNAEDVRAAERRTAAFRRAAKAAELRSLRYQVNPHFLFNTLNSLSALVMTGRRDHAEQMIQTLANFYRTSLAGDPTADVPLDEEVRLQRLYLEIEVARFPQRLKTEFVIPEAIAAACVPGLILQPLVENAVKHGVAATTRAVTIAIRAHDEGDRLIVAVSDDAGASGGASGSGSVGDGDGSDGCGGGIGLANVRDRLAARFGDDAAMVVTHDPARFTVTLTMPLVRSGC